MANSTGSASAEKLPTKEDFAALLEESFGATPGLEGTVVKGTVVGIENDMAVIDVGLKSEGRVPVKDFGAPGQASEIKIGDEVEVFLDRMENAHGEAVHQPREGPPRGSLDHLEKAFEKNERVDGVIFGRVKGGFTVDLSGAVAFLPGSQVDVRPVRDVTPLMNIPQPFQILKMDRRRGNIVVSRRAVLEEARAEARTELISVLKEGQVLEGVVKNITDYGAFVDLGGIDGLLHVTDIAWRRVGHPTEALSIGQTVNVQVIKVNPETQRISLGMKQLEADPWEGVDVKYPVGVKFTGRVTNITDYGAFVELEPGVEGLVHVSEMSWTKKNVHPGKIVSTSQEVEVMVLDVDPKKRRISLGLKQCMENPWTDFAAEISGRYADRGRDQEHHRIRSVRRPRGRHRRHGPSVRSRLGDPGDEAIKNYKKGDVVKGVVLDVDIEKERVSLGIKQLTADPIKSVGTLKKGDVVTCTVAGVQDNGIEVTVGDGMHAFIRRSDLARDRSEQRPDKFAVGDKVDAQVTNFDKASRKITLSIKAREISEEKEAVAQYGSSDSGASLGDILGAAISKAREAADGSDDDEDEADAKPAKKAKSSKAKKEADADDADDSAD